MQCEICGRKMSQSEPAYVLRDKAACARCYSRRGNGKAILVVILLLAVVGYGVFYYSNHPSLWPNNAITAHASSHPTFNFADVFAPGTECLYTGSEYDALPVLGTNSQVSLRKLQHVKVKEVLHSDPGSDYMHPDSAGYKLYISPIAAPSRTLVLYPTSVIVNKTTNEIEDVDIHLCRLADFQAASDQWRSKSFVFTGTKIGEVEVQSGTVVKVVSVAPASVYHYFDLTVTLPSGSQAVYFTAPDDPSLKPADER